MLFILNYPVVYYISKYFVYIPAHSFPLLLRFRRGDDILGGWDSPFKGQEVVFSLSWPRDAHKIGSSCHLPTVGPWLRPELGSNCVPSLGPKYGGGLANVGICMRGCGVTWAKPETTWGHAAF